MTIEKLITEESKIAQELQKVFDTHMTSNNFSLEEMYADDEVIKEHLQKCKISADYHYQIAGILTKYQKIQEILNKDFEEYCNPLDRDRHKFSLIKKEVENGNDN